MKPMTLVIHPSKILRYHIYGIGLIIAISWVDEILGLPSRLFGGAYLPNFRESLVETAIILIVAIPSLLLTKRLLARLTYIEGFLHVCAWCRKINHNGQWIPIEEFFKSRFATDTSHGICPNCAAEFKRTKP